MLFQINALIYLIAAASAGFGLIYLAFPKDRKFLGSLYLLFWGLTTFYFLNNIFAIACIVVIFTVFSFTRSKYFLGFYTFLIFTTPFLSQPVQLGGVYLIDFSFAHCLSIGALGAILVGKRNVRRASGPADLCVVILILLFFLADLRGSSATNVLREFSNSILSYVLPYYVLSRAARDEEELRAAFVGLGCAVSVLSAIAVFEVWRSWPIYRGMWGHYGIELTSGASVKLRGGIMRSAGPYPEPLSLSFAMTIAFTALMAMHKRFTLNRYYWVLLGLCLVGLVMPQGRTAWIGCLVAFLALDLYRREMSVLAIKLALLGIGGMILLLVSSFSQRIATLLGITAEGQGTVDYRQRLLERGIEEFWKHPWLGDSINNVLGRMQDLIQGEGIVDLVNGYLHVALISGAVGLAVLLITVIVFLALLVQQGARKRQKTSPFIQDALAWSFASVFAILIMLTTMSIIGRPFLMLIIVFALGATAMRIARNDRRAQLNATIRDQWTDQAR
jgi:hypothetical protein